MNADFCDGFAKEAGVATFLRNEGRKIMRGAGKVFRGVGQAGQATGRVIGHGVGAAAAAPIAATGKAVEVAGKTVRNVENRVRGSMMGGAMGHAHLRRALRAGTHAPAAAPAAASSAPAADHRLGAALRAHGVQTKSLAKARETASAAETSKKRWRGLAGVAGVGAIGYGLAAGSKRPRNEESAFSQN